MTATSTTTGTAARIEHPVTDATHSSREQALPVRRARPRRINRALLIAGLLGAIATGSGIALTATSGWLIVKASEQPPILTLMTAIVGVRAFGMARVAFRYFERLRSHDAALADLADARASAYTRLVPLTPARLGRRGRADVLSGVVDDLTDISEASVRVTVPLISTGLAGVLAVVLASWALPSAGAVLAAMLAASVLLMVAAARMESTGQHDLLAARAAVTSVAALVTDHANELRAIGGTSQALGWVQDAHRRLQTITDRQARGRALITGGLPLITALATVAAAVLAVDTDLHPGLKALLVLTPIALGEALGVLADVSRAHVRARASADRVSALVDQKPAVLDPKTAEFDQKPATVDQKPATVDQKPAVVAIEEQNTATRVPHLRIRALRAGWSEDAVHLGPIDLDLPAGTRLAVTGANGTGKSTLLAVLARHLDPSSGTLSIDGVDAQRLPLDSVRAQIAIVDDEPHVFATTLRENLRLALPPHTRNPDGVEAPEQTDRLLLDALTDAGLLGWYSGLADGLDTRLGADGRGISGGERTRLAIARALLSGRPIILLDEPTAHLDDASARAVLADLNAAAAGRTIVMVTHHGAGVEQFTRTIELSMPRTSVGWEQ